MSKLTDGQPCRLQRAATSPVQVASDSSSLDALHDATLAAEAEQSAASRDAIIELDARLDAAGIPPAPEDGD